MTDTPLVCRSCSAAGLIPVLSLGNMPLANDLVAPEDLDKPLETFPLDLVYCPACSLVQITETVPPERLFREYLYFSSYSATMLAHAQELADRLIQTRHLGRGTLVVELASNDGYLLQFYQRQGIPVLGIEPARNIAKVAEEKGIPTLCDFFGLEMAKRLPECADVVHAHNVLAHVADLNGFVEGIATILKPDGVAVVEVPYVADMVERCEFDTVYHEHLCYFSLGSLEPLFERNGLFVKDVERMPIHGGSLLLFVERIDHPGAPVYFPSIRALRREERRLRLNGLPFYAGFAARIVKAREDLRGLLLSLKADGKRIAGYGAAAKGVMLLNYCGIGRDILDFVADRSEHKQGRYIPGVGVGISSPYRLLEEMPDYLLILAWNLADEIMSQQAEYRRRGGRFILPIPEVRIVDP